MSPSNKKIIVVGGGGGGLCASIAAADAGAAEVTLLEKLPRLGGDTIISDYIISAAGTDLQRRAGIQDTPHQHLVDHLVGGRYRSDIALSATLVENGAAAWDWLADKGCQFPEPTALHVQHDHTIARSVKMAPPGMIPPLKQSAIARGVKILLETRATELLVRDGAIAGLRVEREGQSLDLPADSIILACGGFGSNPEMIRKICPTLGDAVSWSTAGNTGDGIRIAEAIGANTIHYPELPLDGIRVIQCGSDVKNKILHPTYILAQTRAQGAIMVAPDGRRFFNEHGRSYEMVQAAIARGPFYFLIFDATMATPSRWLPEKTFEKQLENAVRDGLVAASAATLDELAAQIDVPASALSETIARWNRDVAAGQDTEFGRTEGLGQIVAPPFYSLRFKPAIVQTLGGLEIDVHSRVLDKSGRFIPGLYAVGQVAGGVHGPDYIGGNALLDLVVFGVIAGENSLRLLQGKELFSWKALRVRSGGDQA